MSYEIRIIFQDVDRTCTLDFFIKIMQTQILRFLKYNCNVKCLYFLKMIIVKNVCWIFKEILSMYVS